MLGRISNSMLVNANLIHINNNMQRIQKTQEQISSGKKIRVPSDDPIGTTQSMKIKADIKKAKQFVKNLDNGISYMENTSSTIGKIENVLLEIKGIAESATAVNTTSADRTAFAFEVNQLLEELIQLSNSKYQGKFIFGGTETLSGTQTNTSPFNMQLSGTSISSVIPNPDGIDGQIMRSIGEGKNITINISGKDMLQPAGSGGNNDIFQTVITLRENLLGNNEDGIRNQLRNLDNEYDNVVNQNTIIGSKINRLHLVADQLTDLGLIQKEQLSQIEDTDIAEAILELRTQQTTLQATLETSARILKLSLLDFI